MWKFSRYSEQYRANLKLAAPVVLSQLGNIVVQIVDNAMVGRYGGDDPTPLAATAFGGSIFFIAMISVMGLTFGITPLVGALFAQKRTAVVSKYLQNGVVLYNIIAVAMVAILLAIIPLFRFMGQPAEVVEMSIPYFKTLVWSLIPVIVFFSFKQFFEGVGNTKLAMIAVVVSNVVNIALNYLLIGGNMGAPELGALGAGLATATSRVVSAIILVYYFLRHRDYAIYRSHFRWRLFSWAAIKRLVTMGVPISMQMTLEVASFVIIGLMFGWFSAAEIGANQIGIAMSNCSFMIIVAVGSATTIRISHCYGLRDYAQLKLAGYAAWHLALVWNIISATIYFVFRSDLPRLFTSNAETIELASVLLLAIAAFQIPDGIQCIAIGILRGMQDVKIVPYIAFISYWVFNMPIAYLCAFPLGMGAPGLYVGYFVGFAVASVLLILRIRNRQRLLEQGGR